MIKTIIDIINKIQAIQKILNLFQEFSYEKKLL
jgi:hypothetical protein